MVSNLFAVLAIIFSAKLTKKIEKDLVALAESSVKSGFLVEDKKFQKTTSILLKRSI